MSEPNVCATTATRANIDREWHAYEASLKSFPSGSNVCAAEAPKDQTMSQAAALTAMSKKIARFQDEIEKHKLEKEILEKNLDDVKEQLNEALQTRDGLEMLLEEANRKEKNKELPLPKKQVVLDRELGELKERYCQTSFLLEKEYKKGRVDSGDNPKVPKHLCCDASLKTGETVLLKGGASPTRITPSNDAAEECKTYKTSLKSVYLTSGVGTALAQRERIHFWRDPPFLQIVELSFSPRKFRNDGTPSTKREIAWVHLVHLKVQDANGFIFACSIDLVLKETIKNFDLNGENFKDFFRVGTILKIKGAVPLYHQHEDNPDHCYVVLNIHNLERVVGYSPLDPPRKSKEVVAMASMHMAPRECPCSPFGQHEMRAPIYYCSGDCCSVKGLDFDLCVLVDTPVEALCLEGIAEFFPFTTMSVDAMAPNHKRNLAYYYYATQVYGFHGHKKRFEMPECIRFAVRNYWPNKRGVPYSDDTNKEPEKLAEPKTPPSSTLKKKKYHNDD